MKTIKKAIFIGLSIPFFLTSCGMFKNDCDCPNVGERNHKGENQYQIKAETKEAKETS